MRKEAKLVIIIMVVNGCFRTRQTPAFWANGGEILIKQQTGRRNLNIYFAFLIKGYDIVVC